MKESRERSPVSSEKYSAEYFLTECGGWSEYTRTKGEVLPERLAYALRIGAVSPGMRVLDAGCGRGEVLLHCCRAGASAIGVDYSYAALNLARDLLLDSTRIGQVPIGILGSDVKHLPFRDGYFDRVFALDIVEHLHEWELGQALREFHRVLAPHGRLIVHTMPNRWYYTFGYPLYRALQWMRGRKLPRDPRRRWKFVPDVHVNEQDPFSLKQALRRAGFASKVWLRPVRPSISGRSSFEAIAERVISGIFPFKLVFCGSIFAIAEPIRAKGLKT